MNSFISSVAWSSHKKPLEQWLGQKVNSLAYAYICVCVCSVWFMSCHVCPLIQMLTQNLLSFARKHSTDSKMHATSTPSSKDGHKPSSQHTPQGNAQRRDTASNIAYSTPSSRAMAAFATSVGSQEVIATGDDEIVSANDSSALMQLFTLPHHNEIIIL
jgi:hypothetical protein